MDMQQTANPGVVIVGAGHAGGRAAERLRAFGYDKPISVIGREPHQPYERPPLSKSVLTGKTECMLPELLSQENWQALHINFFVGTDCLSVDRQRQTVSLSTGAVLPYEHLILATGLTPRELPLFSSQENGVFCVNSYDESTSLRARLRSPGHVLIIGAGFIGLEVAASASQLEAEVTVVEMGHRPLQRVLSAELSDWISNWHRLKGITIHCGRHVVAQEKRAGQHIVRLDDDREIATDLIVVGIGGIPNVGLADEAGLELDDGIVVDQTCRSSDPNIYAVGDIARIVDSADQTSRRLESWKNAEDTAAVAARNICGETAVYDEVPWFWTDQFGHNLQLTGDLSASADVYERGKIGDPGYLTYFANGDKLLGAFGIDCGGDIRRARGHIEKCRPLTTRALEKAGLQAGNHQQVFAAQGYAR